MYRESRIFIYGGVTLCCVRDVSKKKKNMFSFSLGGGDFYSGKGTYQLQHYFIYTWTHKWGRGGLGADMRRGL